MHKKRIAWVLVLAIPLGFWVSASPATLAGPVEDEVLAFGQQFFQAFNAGDWETFASLWWQSEETTDFEPMDPFRMDGWSQVSGLWRPFLNFIAEAPPGGFSISPRQQRVTSLGDDAVLLTGHFVGNSQFPTVPEAFAGRFTLVLQKRQGKWLIVHAHASFLPEP